MSPLSAPTDVPSVEGRHDRVALGRAVQGRAQEVADAVVAAWSLRYSEATVPYAAMQQVVDDTCRLGTELIGRYLATGEGATRQEAQHLAERSSTLVVDQFAMTDVLKNYLLWRDETLRVVRQEATRLGVGPALVSEAATVVRLSSDVSLINMVKEFDVQRRDLQRRLDDERAKLTHLALHDSLTGLANRTLLLDRLAHAIVGMARRPEKVGVLFLDLDGFKGVNDTYGHPAGDRLLIAVADRLTRLVRPSDTVARLGGDEFVIVCSDLLGGEAGLAAFAERIRAGVARPDGDEEDIPVSASVGGAIADVGAEPEQVLACADAAMYAVKHRSGDPDHVLARPAVQPVMLRAGP